MIERNRCHDLGCPADCCRNINSHWATREEWFKLAFPSAIKVETVDELESKKDIRDNHIYYYCRSSSVDVIVNGACPNQDGFQNCLIHEERFFPNPCRNTIPGSDKCHELQKKQAVLSVILEESGPIDRSAIFRVIDKLNS